MNMFLKRHAAWLLPVVLFAVITPFTPHWDLSISSYFYTPDRGFSSNGFFRWFYTFGLLPGQLLVVGAAVMLVLASFTKRWRSWYSASLIVVLTLVIGSGVVIHALLKDNWGRPRPRQVIEFGGTQPFRPYYEPNFFHQTETSKSFSCGHCSMGYYFFALALIAYYRKKRTLFWAALIAAIVLGGLLSWARIAQGGHFLSDVLASALIMWLTAYFCTRWLLASEEA